MNAARESHYRIAIVGGGPRGLAALEYLFATLAHTTSTPGVRVILFEASAYPGSGPNYAADQFSGSLLNLPERELSIPSRAESTFGNHVIAGFPSYKEWAGVGDGEESKHVVDHYPQRARLGEYLQARFDNLAAPLKHRGWLTVVESEVLQIRRDAPTGKFRIVHASGEIEALDEVVLAVGHQQTKPDKALQAWGRFAQSHAACRLITTTYPLEDYVKDISIGSDSIVALRGFGLSMIDVVKGLTEGRGGRYIVTDEFRRTKVYVASGLEPAKIIPFSLDGLPMAAKPLNRWLDERFAPESKLADNFEKDCSTLASSGEGKEMFSHLLKLVSHTHAAVFAVARPEIVTEYTLSQLSDVGISWLQDEQYRHEIILDRDLSTECGIQLFVDMACGTEPPSLDYSMGQVWRHLQKIMFHAFSHSNMAIEFVTDLIALHERMKRYAYGPPVESVQCLLALLDSEVLSLATINDPDIRLTKSGWELSDGQRQIVASVMIDTVLSPPVLQDVDTPLVRQLLDEGYLSSLDRSLGASTLPGALAEQDGVQVGLPPVALLGRLANGSILGTDSINESFGDEQREWARQLVQRLTRKQNRS